MSLAERVTPAVVRRVAALLAVLALAACVEQPTVTQPPVQEPVAPAAPAVQPPKTPDVQPPLQPPPPPVKPLAPLAGYPKSLAASGAGPAVLALARQAQESRSAGRYDAALGQWERALRIEPRNAFIWQSIAETQLFLKNSEQAESAAQKSNSLGRGNPWVESANWRLIASARTARGDSAGAQQAASRAEALVAAINAAQQAQAAAAAAAAAASSAAASAASPSP